MSRLILPSRAEVIIREDVLENASDPRPNAFFDARTGMLRVYHGPMYGNPGGSLVPLQAQHVPIGTPAPPPSAWANPWAGMIGGMSGRWPFNVNQRGGGGDQGMQNSGNSGNNHYSRYGCPALPVLFYSVLTITVATGLMVRETILEVRQDHMEKPTITAAHR
jgi:hypothetical protein